MVQRRRTVTCHVLTPLEAVMLSTDFAGNCHSRQGPRRESTSDEQPTGALMRPPRAA